jgi:nitrogen-specific signal transduction histidine kinase
VLVASDEIGGSSSAEEPSGRAARAERDALLDIVAIFAHDLSNPLQSITVLCELGMDDAVPGGEEHLRAQQCLEAADRMRALIHSFAALIRGRSSSAPLGALVERVTTLFARRFDRHAIETQVELGEAADVRGVAGLEFALLNLLLGAVATASDSPLKRYTLHLRAGRVESGDGHWLTVSMQGADDSGAWQPLPLSESHVDRARHVLAATRARLEQGDGRVELFFAGIT